MLWPGMVRVARLTVLPPPPLQDETMNPNRRGSAREVTEFFSHRVRVVFRPAMQPAVGQQTVVLALYQLGLRKWGGYNAVTMRELTVLHGPSVEPLAPCCRVRQTSSMCLEVGAGVSDVSTTYFSPLLLLDICRSQSQIAITQSWNYEVLKYIT